jgi:hypothetical protein
MLCGCHIWHVEIKGILSSGLPVILPIMLLIFVLAFFFQKFQTHAAPLTSLVAESSSNTSVLNIPDCICPADQRSLWDILWACLATLFACTWVSVHPNIPAPDESWWRIFLRRLELMFWTVIGPEFIISWALRQWLGARELEKLYKGDLSRLMNSIYLQILI